MSQLTTDHDSPAPDEGEEVAEVYTSGPIVVTPSGMKSEFAGRQAGADAMTRFVLFNIVIPIALIAAGALVIRVLGTATAKPLPPPDLSFAGRLKALPAARAERIESLESTGKSLELIVDGTVVPYQESRVASEVAGRVVYKSQNCEAGAIVRKSEVLMRIDPTDYELEVERLSRLKEQEYRALGEIDQEMVNAKRNIDVAKQEVKLQLNEVERQLALPKNFASKTEIDRAKATLLQKQSQLLTWENNLDLLRKKRSRLESSEQLAATQLRVAEVNLARTEITAPIDGVIVSEEADLNTFVSRGAPLVTIEDTSKVEVASSLRMDQLHWVLDQDDPSLASEGYDLPDTPAIIEFEVAGRQASIYRWKGHLVSYDGVGLDSETRTVPVRVLVDHPREYFDPSGDVTQNARVSALVRGMFVRVRLQIKPRTPLIVIPADALRPGNRVWIFQEDSSVLDLPSDDDSNPPTTVTEAPENGSNESAEPSETSKLAGTEVSDPTASESDASEKNATEPDGFDPDAFDPDSWTAGKVTVSGAVYPVESLALADDSDDDPTISPLVKSAGRHWVCESRDPAVTDGASIVVSPLGSVGPEGMAVRVQFSETPATDSPSDSSSPITNASVTNAPVTNSSVTKD